ncbi:hypothetical protein SAMN05216388_1001231 [Halorientalis persicus]|uniref:Uncharacterized protein n=1 Tax=Halorientalis persicus TaxID=1367881 RepID=A0A1H8DB39_9EURY|nr:hypothetical protein SAMN05216388_1001231 [Halorientalis persicus]
MQGGGYNPGLGYGLTTTATSATTTGGSSPPEQPLAVAGDKSDMSHLDSFFASSGWTRVDVLVVAAGMQIALWLVLLYLEVTEE